MISHSDFFLSHKNFCSQQLIFISRYIATQSFSRLRFFHSQLVILNLAWKFFIVISQSRLSLTVTREGIFNSTPFCHVWLAMVEKMKENTRNSVWKSEKLFAGERHSGKWWWHRKQIKAKLFDLNKKATANCWRRHYKTSESKFPVPKGLIAQTYHFSNISEPSFGVCVHTALPRLFWCHHLTIVLCIADS